MGYKEQNDDLHLPHASTTNDSHGETECPYTQPMKYVISNTNKGCFIYFLVYKIISLAFSRKSIRADERGI